jgi:hypothetical protein
LPEGLAVRVRERKSLAHGHPPQPWSLAGALAVLRDSAVAPVFNEEKAGADKATAARALVIFSTGAEGTSTTPRTSPIRQSRPAFLSIPWPSSVSHPSCRTMAMHSITARSSMTRSTQAGQCGDLGARMCRFGDRRPSKPPPNYPPIAPYINYPFELVGDLTGGLHFESVNHSQPLGESGQRFVLANPMFSMTGGETDGILERVKRHTLARFSSSYAVGFVPLPSGAPREHKLQVKLAPKSGGKVTEGKRSATY